MQVQLSKILPTRESEKKINNSTTKRRLFKYFSICRESSQVAQRYNDYHLINVVVNDDIKKKKHNFLQRH